MGAIGGLILVNDQATVPRPSQRKTSRNTSRFSFNPPHVISECGVFTGRGHRREKAEFEGLLRRRQSGVRGADQNTIKYILGTI